MRTGLLVVDHGSRKQDSNLLVARSATPPPPLPWLARGRPVSGAYVP